MICTFLDEGELELIVAALAMMQDVDEENGHTDAAERARALSDRLQEERKV